MPHLKSIKALALTICVLGGMLFACSTPAAQTTSYDPNKKYAAFIVMNSPTSPAALANAKQQSMADGYENGPVEYYDPPAKGFDTIVKKVTPSKQITLIWVIGNLMDMPTIRKSAEGLGFKGTFRFFPLSGAVSPVQ
jgi:hypothetical protein